VQMTITDWIQAISTLVLVGVTAYYAWKTHSLSKSTEKQAVASVKMAEEMRNARSPSITIKWIGADPSVRKISTSIENVGLGPALNLKCYLTHQEFASDYKYGGYSTFDVGQKYTLTLPSEGFDFKAWKGLSINCDYESISGEKFRSMLKFESQENRSMQIIKLNSGAKND